MLELKPTAVALTLLDTFRVDVRISGLSGAPAGAYDVDVWFDPLRVQLAAPGYVEFGMGVLREPASALSMGGQCGRSKLRRGAVAGCANVGCAAAGWRDIPDPQNQWASFVFGGVAVSDAFGEQIEVTRIPEPGSAVLIITGIVLALGRVRRRAKM